MSVLDVPPLDPEGDHVLLERLTELALIVAVFSAGLTIERHVQRRSWVSIAVLLGLVMPLTILALAVFGMWAMGLSFGAALLLGAVLAPTDPVLAGDVGLTGPGGEAIGEPRLSLHTEAGFNDGLASPFVVLGLFAAQEGGTGWIGQWLAADLLYGAAAALALGAAAGLAAAAALTRTRNKAWVSPELEGFVTTGMVLVIYGATEAIGAYGLLAVFAAGFSFRRYEFDHDMHKPVHHGAEAAGKTLELLVLLMLGTMLTTTGLSAPGTAGWLLAPLLLLVIRPALVFATIGPKLMDRPARLFLGFFGVRGVAALFYATVVVEAHVLTPENNRSSCGQPSPASSPQSWSTASAPQHSPNAGSAPTNPTRASRSCLLPGYSPPAVRRTDTFKAGRRNVNAWTPARRSPPRVQIVLSGVEIAHRRDGYRDPGSQAFIDSWFQLQERCVWV